MQINHSLKYLLEALSNYENEDTSEQLYEKLEMENYRNELDFVQDLDEEEIDYLNTLLEREMSYATSAQDDIRMKELHTIYELLF